VALTPIVELGVEEAYGLLAGRFGLRDHTPLGAIENEDWGRDYLLSRFQELPARALAEAGLTWDDDFGHEPDSAISPDAEDGSP
jgi:hypothetical protein